MAAKKKAAPKITRGINAAPRGWEADDELYPRSRGVCSFCGQRDDLKLSFDQIHSICVNAHACVLRWSKERNESK